MIRDPEHPLCTEYGFDINQTYKLFINSEAVGNNNGYPATAFISMGDFSGMTPREIFEWMGGIAGFVNGSPLIRTFQQLLVLFETFIYIMGGAWQDVLGNDQTYNMIGTINEVSGTWGPSHYPIVYCYHKTVFPPSFTENLGLPASMPHGAFPPVPLAAAKEEAAAQEQDPGRLLPMAFEEGFMDETDETNDPIMLPLLEGTCPPDDNIEEQPEDETSKSSPRMRATRMTPDPRKAFAPPLEYNYDNNRNTCNNDNKFTS